MAYKTAIEVPRSGNVWIDGLTDGYRWGTTATDPAVGTTFISAWLDESGRAACRARLEAAAARIAQRLFALPEGEA